MGNIFFTTILFSSKHYLPPILTNLSTLLYFSFYLINNNSSKQAAINPVGSVGKHIFHNYPLQQQALLATNFDEFIHVIVFFQFLFDIKKKKFCLPCHLFTKESPPMMAHPIDPCCCSHHRVVAQAAAWIGMIGPPFVQGQREVRPVPRG